ncbi:hypothetical protein E2I00_002934, partial [Balaenoptera physalus]
GLVTEGRRHRRPDLVAPLVGPSGSRPVSSAGRGRGQSSEEGVAGRGQLCGQGAARRAQLHSAIGASDPSSRPLSPCPRCFQRWSCSYSFWLNKQLCYILDAILFLYGIILTLLYCRLKLQVRKAATASL